MTALNVSIGSAQHVRFGRLEPLLAAGLVVALALPLMTVPWNHYDGGISASAATFTLHGLLPYRDYWLLYGPLVGWLLAIPTAIAGPSVELTRLVGLSVLAGQSATVYYLCRRWTERFPALLLAVVVSLVVAVFMGLETTPWPVAMALALGGLALRLESRRPILGGVLIGLAFLARLDLGAYALLAALIVPERGRLLAGFGLCVAPVAVVLTILVPIGALVEQLVWYPLIGPRQFRGMPSLDLLMPMALALPLTVIMAIVPRLVIAISLVRGLAGRRDLLTIGVFAALCQLQTLGRADAAHLAVALPPAIVLLAASLPTARRPALLGIAIAAPPLFAVVAVGMTMALGGSNPKDVAFQRSVDVTKGATGRDTPVFVALASNRYTLGNALLGYYLADRPPGTRWTMFNPGVTNTDATQSLMVADLEASRTNLLILDVSGADSFEYTNDSRIPGSAILDRYIGDHFRTWCDFGSFRVAVRSSWNHNDGCPVADGT